MSHFLSRAKEEPFRLFFPLGIIASAMGVLVWPLAFWGMLDYYPLEAHARWLVIAFGGCFIVGFLGTAGPRLLGSKPFTRFELLLHLAMALGFMVALWLNQIPMADLIAGIWLICVLISLVGRFLFVRRDTPPPGMPLAVLGIAGAATAGILFGLSHPTSPQLHAFLRLLYFQGFLWLPILGVAPYLLPRFFEKSSLHSFDESSSIPRGWLQRFMESLGAGVIFIISLALEAWGHSKFGLGLRALVVTVHLAASVPGLVSWAKTNGLGAALRCVVPCAIAGWLLAAWFPHLRIGVLHMMFIGSAGMLMLAVATRVILGHGNRHDRLASPLRWCHALWMLILFTAATRLTSDFIPKVRISHYIYAALLWVLILAFWAWKIRREFHIPLDETGLPKNRCPRRRKSVNR